MTYLKYARNMEFTQTPDYKYLTNLFRQLIKRSGWTCDWEFDWVSQPLVSTRVHVTTSKLIDSLAIGETYVRGEVFFCKRVDRCLTTAQETEKENFNGEYFIILSII